MDRSLRFLGVVCVCVSAALEDNVMRAYALQGNGTRKRWVGKPVAHEHACLRANKEHKAEKKKNSRR